MPANPPFHRGALETRFYLTKDTSCLAAIHEVKAVGIPKGVDIWLLAFRNGSLDELLFRLTEDERTRCLRYCRQADRIRFAATRAVLKSLLAERLRIASEEIEFEIDSCGKPRLGYDGAPHFNLSHSGRFALIAISDLHPVGVDIEALNATMNASTVAAALTPDELEYCSGRPDAQTFFRIWSGKEAVLKAMGIGIASHSRSVSVEPLDSGRYAVAFHVTAPYIEAWQLPAPPGYVAALAAETSSG